MVSDGLDNDDLYVSVVDDSELLSDDGDTLKFAEGLSENSSQWTISSVSEMWPSLICHD